MDNELLNRSLWSFTSFPAHREFSLTAPSKLENICHKQVKNGPKTVKNGHRNVKNGPESVKIPPEKVTRFTRLRGSCDTLSQHPVYG
jgi:hypothetical protein